MGMTEQKTWFKELYSRATDPDNTRKERIDSWCQWGRVSKNPHDMAKALREIQDLNARL